MTKPVVVRDNTLEQWRTHCNRISDNLGDPAELYVTDAPNNTGVVYSNSSDSYTHPVDEQSAVKSALMDLNDRKLKRTGDTITGHLNIKQNFSTEGNVTLGTTGANTITVNSTAITLPNNLNFDTNLLYLDSTGDKVGIGQVPSSTEKLQVTGNVLITGTLAGSSTATFSGNINANSGTIVSNQSTMNVFNTTSTTVNAFGVATAITIGAATGTTTVRHSLTVAGGASQNFTINDGTTTKFIVDTTNGNTTVSGSITQNGTGNLSVTTTGTVSIAPTSTTTLGTAGQTTTLSGNVSAITNNQTVTLSPTGTGTVAISPAGALTINPTTVSNMNNVNVGAATRGTGAFTSLAANAAVTMTQNTSSTSTTTGTLVVTGGVGISENINAGGYVTVPTLYAQSATGGSLVVRANRTDLTTGYIAFNDTLAATSTTSGAARFAGGVGIVKELYVGLGVKSDSITSIGSGGNGDLTLSGIGTGKVQVSDNLTVTGSITVDTGDLILSSAADVIQTIVSGVAASTANVFATTNTATLNVGDNADVNIGNVSKTTTVRGAAAFSGNITQSGNTTFGTGTGAISLNGNVITPIKVSDGSVLSAELYSASATTSAISTVPILTFSGSTYGSAEITVQAWDATGTRRQLSKVLLTYNGTDTHITEYGTVISGGTQIAVYSTDVNTGNIRLLVTPTTTNSVQYKIIATRWLS